MMMNQQGNTQTMAASLDPNSVENRYVIGASQSQASSYLSSTTGSGAVSWAAHGPNSQPTENGNLSNSTYHHEQVTEPHVKNLQDGLNATSLASSSNLGTTNVTQDYSGYTSYPNSSDPYGYGSTAYTGYYSNYQQQPNHAYPQPVGAYQNTGAPYQPISSFQNTGSYAGPANYSGTYYNPGDYQTAGGYPNSGYSNQTTSWNEGNYANYTSQQYTNYTSDTSGAYNSGTALATSLQYQQQYKQWADYYGQTEVSCAPGTENLSVTSTSNQVCPVPGVTAGHPTAHSQPAPTYNQSWQQDSSTQMSSLQPASTINGTHDSYWKHGTSSLHNHQVSPVQPHFSKPLDPKASYNNFQDQQKVACPQGPNSQYAIGQHIPPSYHSPPVQTPPLLDNLRVSKMQIPTNPRIASNLTLGLPKADKDSSTATTAAKPAYISVSLPKPNEKDMSHDTADSMLKPGTFPKSLRGYVERALGRCKGEAERAASQAVMKEIIKKADSDGTLFSRDWDMEPLFPMPTAETISKDLLSSTPDSALTRNKRSPGRRTKSRWEPLPEEKLIDKLASTTNETVKFGGWIHANQKDRKHISGSVSKEDRLNNVKFLQSEQKSVGKNFQRPVKRRCLAADGFKTADNGDASSDSDKEQSLTSYYSGAIALANSPEERMRRENRSKRFEKGQGIRSENNRFKPNNAGTGNSSTRSAGALVITKNFEDGGIRAVEDIDWDALTVKGTCQEIEKRYLRLTSAPDPSSVRPEEVLEKALLMVQNSQKNYLYKCDQLKSIRQDLTVQRIRNQLTVKVYETHARLAIENGDLPEYNQCQSQLKILYAEGIEGCRMEFSAYHLLCVILFSNNKKELLSSMSRLSDQAKQDKAIKHALAVRGAVSSGNYIMFFRLYKTAPYLNTCLMDLYVEKIRFKAVSCMSRSYRPTVPVSYIAQILGFTGVSRSPTNEGCEEKDSDGLEECVEWLKGHGASVVTDNNGEVLLDAKASSSTLFMPEPEDAVAHGDANLAVNDFLARTSSQPS